jgi:hypothetical protein
MYVEGTSGTKTVEGTSRSSGIGSHLVEHEPFTNFEFGQHHFLGDEIERVAGGSEDVRKEVGVVRVSLVKGKRLWRLVIKEDAVERTVDTIVDVVEHLLFLILGSGVNATRMDGGSEGHGVGSEITARLTNDTNVGREEFVQQGSHDLGNLGEGRRVVISSREATSDVEEGEVEPVGSTEFESGLGKQQSIVVGSGRETAATNVEADADDVEVEFHSSLEKSGPNLSRSSEFGSKLA